MTLLRASTAIVLLSAAVSAFMPCTARADDPEGAAAPSTEATPWESLRNEQSAFLKTGGERYEVWNVEFEDAAACAGFQADNVTVFHSFERWADVFVPQDETDGIPEEISSAPGFVWAELAAMPIVPPARGVELPEATRAIPAPIVRGGFRELTGKGVIVAVIDSGVDFHHPDFIEYDSEGNPVSRLLYFWDTFSGAYAGEKGGAPAPLTYPNGAAIGTVYSRDDITRELRSRRPSIWIWDSNGHGTACAGVAAGNGEGSDGQFPGVAPQADLIAVRIGIGGELEHAFLLAAICRWLDEVAGDRPLVVSCSFGGHRGGHDGFALRERQLDALFPLDRQGRAICIAAGNEGQMAWMHGHAEVGPDAETDDMRWLSGASGALLSVYFNSREKPDLEWSSAKTYVFDEYVHPLTDQYVMEAWVPAGEGFLRLSGDSEQPIRADAYIAGGQFDESCALRSLLIGSPGTASHPITVGSYDWNDEFEVGGNPASFGEQTYFGELPLTIGGLSSYSSPGPRRIGDVLKPDITAPGRYWPTALPVNNDPWIARHTTGMYQLAMGTSFSTPYAAGVIALLLEKRPDLTLGEIRELLAEHATRDRYTGESPNAEWGHGKLDIAAVNRIFQALDKND